MEQFGGRRERMAFAFEHRHITATLSEYFHLEQSLEDTPSVPIRDRIQKK